MSIEVRNDSESGQQAIANRGHASSEMAPAAVGGLLGTAQSQSGRSLRPDQVTEDSLVTTRFGQMKVQSALDLGLLTKAADGRIVEPGNQGAAPQAGPPAERQAAPEAPAGAHNPDQREAAPEREPFLSGDWKAEEIVSAIAAQSSGLTQIQAIREAGAGVDFTDATVGQIATQLGVEPEAARQQLGEVREAFERQARAAVQAEGLDPEAVFEWLQENRGKQLADAVRRQVQDRTTAGYRELARGYLEQLDRIDPEAVLAAELGEGVEVRRANNGRIIVRTPRGEFLWSAAVRDGIVKLGWR